MTELQSWFYRYNAWSFTKHRLWEQCRRAYYYSYIGTALQRPVELDPQRLKQLKKLDTKIVLQGKLIHEVLEDQIEQHHLGRGMNEDDARTQYVQRVEQYRKSATSLIVEYINGETVSEAFFDQIRENGLDQLSMFFGVVWPQLANSEYLRHEKFDRFRVGNTEAIVKIDYASKTSDGRVAISDWKTGADKPEFESDLQIGAYVLWAMVYYGLEPERIRSELIYLTTGAVRAYEFSLEQLEKIRQLIVYDFEEMNRSYDVEYFPPNPNPRECLSCHFSLICSHSMARELLDG